MNSRKYRFCLAFLILFVLAGSVFYYAWNEKNAKEPVDGLFGENSRSMEGWENA